MPPAKPCPRRPFMVCVTFILYCRAGVYARRTDDFLIFIMCGGVCARRRVSEANRRAAAALRPEIKTPPYRTAYTVVFPVNPAQRAPLPGRMHAAPTNHGKRGRATIPHDGGVTVHGGRERPPYRVA